MADTSGIKAGRAYIELGIGDKLASGLNKAKARLQSFGKGMTTWGSKLAIAAGALSGPATIAAHAFAESGDAIAKASKRTGMSTEALSELGYAAELAGTDLGTVEGAIRKMQKATTAAASGSKSAAKALSAIGLSAADLAGLGTEEKFTLIAEAISRIEDPSKRAAAAMAIFGKSGTALLPMIEKGADGLAATREEARRLGFSMSGQSAKAAESLTEAFLMLKKVTMGIFKALGYALAPSLEDFARRAAVVGVEIKNWIKDNRELIGSILRIAAGVAAFGAGVALAGKVVGIFAAGLGIIGALLAFLLSPVTLVIAAIAGLSVAFFTLTDSGQKALGWLAEGFATLKDDATAAWGGIAASLATGDIAGAAKILWATLKLEWQRGISALTSLWIAFRDGFSDIMASLGPIMLEVGKRLVATMLEVGTRAGAALWKAMTSYGEVKAVTDAYKKAENDAIVNSTRRMTGVNDRRDKGLITQEQAEAEGAKITASLTKLLARQREVRDQSLEEIANGGKGPDLGAVLKDIWAKPMPALDTKKFEDRMKGIGLAPEDQKKVDAATAALAAAVEDRDKLLKDARDSADYQEYMKELNGTEVTAKGGAGIFGRIKDGQAAAEAQQKTTVAGTFNAVRLAGFGTSDTLGKVAAATERTADNTDDMADALEDATEFG